MREEPRKMKSGNNLGEGAENHPCEEKPSYHSGQ